MTTNELDPLFAALAADPSNSLLRLTIIRRLVGLGGKSRALDLALELDRAKVESPEDRRVISELFKEAGLAEVAMLWSGETGDGGEGQRGLRLVGGRDMARERFVELPESAAAPTRFAQVGGLADVKRDIERRIIAPFTQQGLFQKFRRRTGGGVLLYGPPGCGKTLLARATAGECGLPFQAVSIPDILDPMFGVAEQRLAAVFDNARANAPAVLFFDEIDALAAKRTPMMSTHVSQLVSHFLNEMDGAEADNSGLLVLAATNIPWAVDSAFLRPGRFDRLFFVPPPDKAAREAILKLELSGRPQTQDVDVRALAERTGGCSGADLAAIIERAVDVAIDESMAQRSEIPISQKMLTVAAGEVRSSVLDWLTTARNYATYSNESGRYNEILAFLQKNARN